MRLKYLFFFCIIVFSSITYAQTQTSYIPTRAVPKDLGINSRATESIIFQIGSGTSFRTYYGTESCTGSGTAGLVKILTGLPYVEYLYSAGSSTINFSGFTHVAIGGSDIPSASSVVGKIDAVAGTGTTNVFTDTTLAGQGTLTATVRANGVDISPTEISYLGGISSNIQTQITTATGSITAHTHTGSDGTTQIAHNNVTGTGTNSHPTIDNFIASKASASGLASLDANSLVVQNLASGTSTPGANKTVMSDGIGKISDGWLNDTVTKLGTPTTDNISEGGTNKYYTDNRVNAVIGSSSITSPQVSPKITFTSPAAGQFLKIVDAQGNVENGTSSVSVDFSAVTGSVSASQLPPLSAGTTTMLSIANCLYSNVTGTITVVAIPFDGNNGTATTYDYSTYHGTVTLGGSVVATSTSKYGVGAAYVPNGSTLSIADADYLDIGTNTPFAIRGWWKFTNRDNVMVEKGEGNAPNTFRLEYRSGVPDVTVHSSSVDIFGGWSFTPSFTNYMYYEWNRDDAGTNRLFIDGSLKRVGTHTNAITTNNSNLEIGAFALNPVANFDGYVDGLEILIGTSGGHTGTYTVPLVEVAFGTQTFTYTLTELNKVSYLDTGTNTAGSSYIYCNATTTVWGLGTNTAITGTSSGAYAGWSNRPIRVLAVDIGSSKEIKDNIKTIKIKPDLLDAEGLAKQNYIANNKIAWIAANGGSYTTIVNETGTGSVIVGDTDTMESDFNNYIELEWASDLSKNVYIENVQKQHEQGFWQMFDSVTPKSWNPKDNPGAEYEGFLVREMPPVVWGEDKQSVNLMSVVAYMTVVQKSLKADTIFALDTLKELITTGTVTQQKIDYCNDRLEVLNP